MSLHPPPPGQSYRVHIFLYTQRELQLVCHAKTPLLHCYFTCSCASTGLAYCGIISNVNLGTLCICVSLCMGGREMETGSLSCILDDSVRSTAGLKAYKSEGNFETPPLSSSHLRICSPYCTALQQHSCSSKQDYKRQAAVIITEIYFFSSLDSPSRSRPPYEVT